jgi:N-acetylneuraminic acid mutarotase
MRQTQRQAANFVVWLLVSPSIRTRRLPITALVIVVATAANVGGTSAGSTPEAGGSGRGLVGSWRRAASMLHARSAHAVVSLNGNIYALAGSGPGGPVLAVERYDGKTWVDETTLPGSGLNAPAAVVLNGLIYVIGGFEEVGNVPTNAVHVYDPATGRWRDAAPLPAPRGGHAAVALAGKIHVFGGGNSTSTIADHSVYDPVTDSWNAAAKLPRAEGSPAAVVFRGRIYSIGGRSGSSDFGAVDIYNPATDTWERGPRVGPRGTAGAVVYRSAVYLFGGESQSRGKTLNDVLRLDPKANSWRRVNRMPTARNYARAVLLNDAVYVVGGSRVAGASHSSAGSKIVERFFVRR